MPDKLFLSIVTPTRGNFSDYWREQLLDDFVHPDILELAKNYFQKFPESWVLCLKSSKIDQNDSEKIKAE